MPSFSTQVYRFARVGLRVKSSKDKNHNYILKNDGIIIQLSVGGLSHHILKKNIFVTMTYEKNVFLLR